jgi:precorrin isomerase
MKEVHLDGQRYQVFGYANAPISGFHATAYKNRATGDIIIAYRGTDPGLFFGKTSAKKADHALTTVQDIAVDATMVRNVVNSQKSAADAFTALLHDSARHGRIHETGHGRSGQGYRSRDELTQDHA